MELFLVVLWVDYEGPYPYGIYTTEEKAQEAIDNSPRHELVPKKDVKVHQVPVNEPMKLDY